MLSHASVTFFPGGNSYIHHLKSSCDQCNHNSSELLCSCEYCYGSVFPIWKIELLSTSLQCKNQLSING